MASILSYIKKTFSRCPQLGVSLNNQHRTSIYWCTAVLFLFSVSACSSSRTINNAVTKPKTEAKIITPNQQVPTPADVNYVYDYEEIFTPAEEKKLDSLVRMFEKSNLIPIKISTVNNPSITVENFDQHNKAELTEWETVHGKSNHCMSILISKKLRRIRIDYGSFVSRLLSDNETKTIIENQFTPHFKEGQFFNGTWDGANALMDTIRKNIKL